jgi:mono/diheme cytochrome c family protein
MRCGLNRLHAQSKAMLAAMLSAFGLVAGAGAQELQDDAALVARGAYLARAADCAPCHTGNASQPFAGGLGLKTPFGTLFSVNITSDPETGIGKWTFDQFKNALHQGIRADGAYLYPGMPFDAFTKIEEDDLEALWAYVRRIPPVNAPNPQNQLWFPFDVRLGMLAWRELFFSPGYFKPAAGKSAEWNRGAYLVEASPIARIATARATSWEPSRARPCSPGPRSTVSMRPTSRQARWRRHGPGTT